MNLIIWLYRFHSETIQTVFLTKKKNKLPCETILHFFFLSASFSPSFQLGKWNLLISCDVYKAPVTVQKSNSFAKWNWWNRFLGLIWSNSQYELYICLIYDSSPKSGPWPILLDALALCRWTSQTIGTKWLFRKWAVSLLLSQEGKHPLQSGHRLWTVEGKSLCELLVQLR